MEFTIIPNSQGTHKFNRVSSYICVTHRYKHLFGIDEDQINDRSYIEKYIRLCHFNPRSIVTTYYIMKFNRIIRRYVPGMGMIRTGEYIPYMQILRNKYQDKFVRERKDSLSYGTPLPTLREYLSTTQHTNTA